MTSSSLLNTMHIIAVPSTMSLQALMEEICTCIAEIKQPVLLSLPEGPVEALRRPGDFLTLRTLKRQLDTQLIFVVPKNPRLREWAKHHNFFSFETQEDLEAALSRGLFSPTGFVSRTPGEHHAQPSFSQFFDRGGLPIQGLRRVPLQREKDDSGHLLPSPFPRSSHRTGARKTFASRSIFKSRRAQVAMVVGLFLLLVAGIFPFVTLVEGMHRLAASPPLQRLGIGVTRTSDGEYIGLSDGAWSFDREVDRADRELKRRASDAFRMGDFGRAATLWHSATQEDTNDPEALIYLEDQRVRDSGYSYISLVVGTMDSGTYVGLGRDDLQGAYLTQREYNAGCKLPNCLQVRLLIASTGNQSDYAIPVARQIVQAALLDKTIVGVMGWPYSSRTINVVKILTDARIPIVSQMASSVILSGISPYFFRTVPPDSAQAQAGAVYVEHTLHARKAVLFLDTGDAYSASIGEAFKQRFVADGNTVVATEQFTAGKPEETIPHGLQDALSHAPDIIYFAGVTSDINTLLTRLPTSGPYAHIDVMGGDGLYEVHSYSSTARRGFTRLRFTAFAYPDEWADQGLQQQEPAFFHDYAATFDPFNQHGFGSIVYGYNRADGDAILSYDAVMVLLEACKLAFHQTHGHIRPSDVRQALTTIRGSRTIQGTTGQIAFGSDGNPVNKAVVVLKVSPEGYIQMVGLRGQFLKAK